MAEKTDGLSEFEREAVKDRAKELRAEAKAGKNRAAGEKVIREAIDAMEGGDREVGEGFYRVVSSVAPQLVPKTYYGMPAYANGEGKVVVFMQPSGKFKARYSTIGFEDRANLDDGDMWPTSFAVLAWTPAVESRLAELVAAAVG
ncbi:hypothetical protein GCM10017608_14970 [Agromyces luteolus]|uniref:DUF1801 domain-containing protein n=1 Tax=Agromyces luteolus TaxID=88373 RepID=A0A7C9HIE7_9MICO|nr:hypothetical protein [Agromyces luteolus]MUN07788.1 hypothetical protein [Agromyces luteolus]GLK27563.1 hypothetical protein GCM10017608_14970 [Agromyces luteolus]